MSNSRQFTGAVPLRGAPDATRRHRPNRASLSCESLELRQLLSADASVYIASARSSRRPTSR